ncbi:hypothetical protein BDA99DRAFT_507615 [Phascolomyces articulosus]|uniref:Uncharacterized protein n=1 Tax=Phascolomyces articulosus TaxID=60185 RepID=A0AAD5K1U4_9FUNG|nr:hypothetical protein BDA99DRAFT_507615 [Phascolomyces articulosus]
MIIMGTERTPDTDGQETWCQNRQPVQAHHCYCIINQSLRSTHNNTDDIVIINESSSNNNTIRSSKITSSSAHVLKPKDRIFEVSQLPAKFRSSKAFYLNNEDHVFQVRASQILEARKKLHPNDLTTKETASQLDSILSEDLLSSIKSILVATNPHVSSNRTNQLAYYNWVIVDLCRRMSIIQNRVIHRYGNINKESRMRPVIEHLLNDPNIVGITSSGTTKASISIYAKLDDGEYADYFTPFVESKRSRILDIVEQFGDEICLFTEFIDIKQIGDMEEQEYQDFLHDLYLIKDGLEPRIQNIHFIFDDSFPIASYNKVTFLNPKNNHP